MLAQVAFVVLGLGLASGALLPQPAVGHTVRWYAGSPQRAIVSAALVDSGVAVADEAASTVVGSTPPQLTLLSPCKINLFLRILRRRADGFHELASLFQTVSLFDTLDFWELPADPCEARAFKSGSSSTAAAAPSLLA